MDPVTIIPLAMRGAERIIIVVVAALCIYLGYKLFKIVPDRHEGEGSLSLGDLSISLSKIGPGVFFSLFGAVILYQALQSIVALEIDQSNPPNGEIDDQLTHTNINWMGSQDPDTSIWVDRAIAPIKVLNCLERNATGNENEKGRITESVHMAKVAIIADVWQVEWGDSDVFLQLNVGSIATDSEPGAIYHAIDEKC